MNHVVIILYKYNKLHIDGNVEQKDLKTIICTAGAFGYILVSSTLTAISERFDKKKFKIIFVENKNLKPFVKDYKL